MALPKLLCHRVQPLRCVTEEMRVDFELLYLIQWAVSSKVELQSPLANLLGRARGVKRHSGLRLRRLKGLADDVMS